jgi:hypothetical protein
MLTWLYELLMSFVTMILGFFGIDMKKKNVSFADEAEKKETESVPSSQNELPEPIQ